jgi:tRNA A37 threonylcarbamoyladenosine dehydratase
VRIGDLATTIQDPLLARVRSLLRRDHGFPRGPGKKFGVPAVFSTEALRAPPLQAACATTGGGGGLSCAGFGSSVCVTAVFGMAAAAHAIQLLVKE